MTRKLMVMTYDGLTGRDDRDPTPADIAAWLHAHPAEAVEIVREARVASPWIKGIDAWVRTDLRGRSVILVWPDQWAITGGPQVSVPTDMDTAATKSAADAALSAAGWSLADG